MTMDEYAASFAAERETTGARIARAMFDSIFAVLTVLTGARWVK